MEQRWSNVVIVLFWLATMTWLVVEKVLPGLQQGEPPNIRSVYAAADREPQVGWKVSWNQQDIGWALSNMRRISSGMTEVHSQVHLEQIPLDQVVPALLRPQVRKLFGQIDAESRLEIDPLNRLAGFRSVIQVPGLPEPLIIEGAPDNGRLKLHAEGANIPWLNDWTIPADSLFRDELSPQMTMPGLRVGQTWTAPLCNPFSISHSLMEVLQASVEGHELIMWNGTPVDTLLVVYRGDPGSAFGASRIPRGKLWVDRDGEVLRQEVSLFNSHVAFERMNEKESLETARTALRLDPAAGNETPPQDDEN